jgi:CMD domain protein
MSEHQVPQDVLAAIAGIDPGSRLDSLRQARPRIVESTQATFRAIFEPESGNDLSRIEREAAAIWSATLAKAPDVAAFHRSRLMLHGRAVEHLAALGTSPESPDITDRERAILRHTELLTVRPDSATRTDIDALLNAGVSPAGIVTLSHLVAFISFEVRTIATLNALGGGPVS